MQCPNCKSLNITDIDHQEPGKSFLKLKCNDCGESGVISYE